MENFSGKRKRSTDTENRSNRPQKFEKIPNVTDLNVFPCFLPENHCIYHIENWIDLFAKKSIIVQAYSFSSIAIGEALIDCANRGVKVKILIDKDARQKSSYLQKLEGCRGIEIQVDAHFGKAHNKIIIIDDDYVITGSYNFVDEGDYCDSDTVVFIKDACVNKKFRECYEFIVYENQKFSQKVYSVVSNVLGKIGSLLPLRQSNANVPVDLYDFNPFIRGCSGCRVPLLSLNTLTDDEGFTLVANKNTNKKLKREHTVDIDVCFPRFHYQDCIQLIVDYINNAKKSIFIQACSFTHESISDAITHASTKNIDIKILLDKKALKDIGQKVNNIIKSSGIEVRYDKTCPHGIAHSKTIIIDEDLVLTGSFNLTKSAQNSNLENLLQMRNLILNNQFKEQFYKKWNAGIVTSFRK